MERRPINAQWNLRYRVRRWAREIVLAALLTAVAAAFIANALLRGDEPLPGPSAYETARKPSGK
jgi:hypothetical protein